MRLNWPSPSSARGHTSPASWSRGRRSEQALVSCVQEAYINGVSTRKIDRLVEALGPAGMSKDQVSRLCKALDEQAEAFRSRPLESRYPYLWLGAKIEKVREGGRVQRKALVVAYGVHELGLLERPSPGSRHPCRRSPRCSSRLRRTSLPSAPFRSRTGRS